MTPSIDPMMDGCPYPGLRPFRDDESHIFFGRDEQLDTLLDRLGRSRFLILLGESGSGKTSLVQAGIIPALRAGILGGGEWRIAAMRPGGDPYRNLAVALQNGFLDPGPQATLADVALLMASLRRGPLGLVEAIEGAAGGPVLLIVDQFEEIFRTRVEGNRDETNAFIALLLATAGQPSAPVHILVTLRSDFVGDCTLFSGLPEALNEGQYLNPRMTRDQRRDAIEGPARVFGVHVEPALTNRLLNDTGRDPDSLPMMQYALMRLWTSRFHDWDGSDGDRGATAVLDMLRYEALGGIADAFDHHAEAVFDALREDQKAIAETLFRSLSERRFGGQTVRRPTRLDQIAQYADVPMEEVAAVVDCFREGGINLLSPPFPVRLSPETIIDITHEVALRQWRRLDSWTREEEQSATTYQRIRETARLGQSGQAGLWTGIDLDLALMWCERERPTSAWAERYGGDFPLVMSFLEASQEDRQRIREEREAEEANERALRRRLSRRTVAPLFWIIVTFCLLTGLVHEHHRASEAWARASAAEQALQRHGGSRHDEAPLSADSSSSGQRIRSP